MSGFFRWPMGAVVLLVVALLAGCSDDAEPTVTPPSVLQTTTSSVTTVVSSTTVPAGTATTGAVTLRVPWGSPARSLTSSPATSIWVRAGETPS